MRSLYIQFEDFLGYYINQKTRKYKFNFHFDGIDYPSDRNDRIDRVIEAADRGIVLPQEFASAMGISPMDFDDMMEEAKYGNFTNSLTQLLSIHTATGDGGDGKRGRPLKRRNESDRRDYDADEK